MGDFLKSLILMIVAIIIVSIFGKSPEEYKTEQQTKQQEQISDKQGSEDADIVLTDKSNIKIQMISPLTGEG